MVAGVSRTFAPPASARSHSPNCNAWHAVMDRHQRRTARRVDGDRGTLQAQPIADPSRCCGVGRPDGHIGLDLGGTSVHRMPSPGSRGRPIPRTHRCWAAKAVGAVPSAPPRATPFQQEPMLRVHQPDLARRHTENGASKPVTSADEARTTGHDLAGRSGFRVEEFVDIPAVLGHLRYRVTTFAQHVPNPSASATPENAPHSPRLQTGRARSSSADAMAALVSAVRMRFVVDLQRAKITVDGYYCTLTSGTRDAPFRVGRLRGDGG